MTITNHSYYPRPIPTSSSSILSGLEKEKVNQNSSFNKSALGFIVLLMSASISTDIEYNSGITETHSSIFAYQNFMEQDLGINVLHNFISNILSNSEDIDSDIVELVNKNFWDLI